MLLSKDGLVPLEKNLRFNVAQTNSFPKKFTHALENTGLSFINGYSHYHLMDYFDVSFFTPIYNCSKNWILSKLSILKLSEFEKFQELLPDALSLGNMPNKHYLLKNKFVPSLTLKDTKIPLFEVNPEFVYRGVFRIDDIYLLEHFLSTENGSVIIENIKSKYVFVDSYVSFDKNLYFSKVANKL